ncbi:hypothetical protein SZ64_16815 [Erythrobacter sp. SG61-1L]|uniref:hypothetical protein n=1 Tax=Erythrobacter sp. SG61-1L TaxID=1603897 RepID=UPI0006C92DCD|nr:hypothetical protein [Erythrobacter sp. SG61-1L]KPL69607.1 hypothetical protein SZ64_16815 [Erythrobacter sp. SG61-1L]
MNTYGHTRGHPVIVLVLVIGGWIGFRGALWDAPRLEAARPDTSQPFGSWPVAPGAQSAMGSYFVGPPAALVQSTVQAAPSPQFVYLVAQPEPGLFERIALQLGFVRPEANLYGQAGGTVSAGPAPVFASGPQSIAPWSYVLTGGTGLAEPAPASAAPQAAPFQPPVQAAQAAPLRRWSADGWAMWRQDTTPSLASGNGSYGQSQAGMVMRYRVIPSSGHRPELYGRLSQAMTGAQEVEGALGASVRPVPGLPVSLAAEGRITQVNGGTSIRPAAFAVAQMPRVGLPLGVEADAYVQGGYVWGDYSSAFVDGQARAERPVVKIGQYEVNAGAGIWGGAQKGAARLDVGPTASVYVPVGKLGSRVSVDWRFRVAGDAEPSDGPAVTVSTGF